MPGLGKCRGELCRVPVADERPSSRRETSVAVRTGFRPKSDPRAYTGFKFTPDPIRVKFWVQYTDIRLLFYSMLVLPFKDISILKMQCLFKP